MPKPFLPLLLNCLIIFAYTTDTNAENSPSPNEMVVAGNNTITWLVVSQPNQQQLRQLFFYLDTDSNTFRPAFGIKPQTGRLARWAPAQVDLHVFFDDGTHYRYRNVKGSGDHRQQRLPDDIVPMAIAGEQETKTKRLWALVDNKIADQVDIKWQETLERLKAQSAEDDAEIKKQETKTSYQPSIERPENSFHLVQFNGYDWQPGFPAPQDLQKSDNIRLFASGNKYHLFQQQNINDSTIRYYRRETDRWTDGPQITLSRPPVSTAVGSTENNLFFAALIEAKQDADLLACECWLLPQNTENQQQTSWNPLPELLDQNGNELILPAGSSIGLGNNQIVLLRTHQGEVQAGLWPIRGQLPAQDFQKVPLELTDRLHDKSQNTREIITAFIIVTVLMIVFWRYQPSIAYPLDLPADTKIAGLGKRALAAILDVIPPAAIILSIYYTPLTEFLEQLKAVSDMPEQAQNMPLPPALIWTWTWFTVVYAAYCMIFEFTLNATPGKLLLGLILLAETQQPPRHTQIFIRNISRLIELMGYPHVWLFILVVLFSRNRQRVGDLIARTVVVEKMHPPDQQNNQTDG